MTDTTQTMPIALGAALGVLLVTGLRRRWWSCP